MTAPTITPVRRKRPPVWKPILAWAAVAIGAISALAAFTNPQDFASIVGSLLLSLALLIPGCWWLWCQHLDDGIAKENAELAASHEQIRQFLTPGDAHYAAALDTAPQKPATERRWKIVVPTAVAALIAGGAILPTPETDADPVTHPTGPSTSTSQTAIPVAEEPDLERQRPSVTEVPAPSVNPADQPLPPPVVEEPAPVEPEPTRQRQRAAQVDPAPAPAPAQAPVSGGDVYYANCTAARAAGAAPIYVGAPGYRSALDRDGDGIACE